MTSDLDVRERHELCDLLDELGPDQPTLCADWTTADLAAHLVVRERDPRSAPGILLGGRYEATVERLMAGQLDRHGYPGTVERVRTGPPWPLRIPPLRHAMNLLEFFIHHEDVRRPNGMGPRVDRPDLDAELWRFSGAWPGSRSDEVVSRASGWLSNAPTASGTRWARATTTVTIVGPPGELALELYGRRSVTEVEYRGDADAVAGCRRPSSASEHRVRPRRGARSAAVTENAPAGLQRPADGDRLSRRRWTAGPG